MKYAKFSFITGFALLALFYLFLNLVFAAGVNVVNLLSPENNSWTNEDNDTIAFVFKYAGDNATASCILYIKNESGSGIYPYAENSSVLNNTNTTLKSNQSIDEGSNQWYVNCTNATWANSQTWFLNVDRKAPSVLLGTNPIDTYNTSNQNIIFDLICTDNLEPDYLQIWGNWTGSWVANQTNSTPYNHTWWNVSVSGIPEGTWKWGAYCNDSTGNSDWSATNRTFTVDIPLPTIILNNPINGTTNSDLFNFTYNEVNCSWYSVDGGANVTNCSIFNLEWTGTLTVSGDGQHNITVWANNSIDEINSTTRYWVRDTAPPVITVQSPQNTTYNTSSLWFNLTLNEEGNACWVIYGGVNSTLTNSSGNWNFNNISVEDGSYQATFYCNDKGGNSNSTSVYFTVDSITFYCTSCSGCSNKIQSASSGETVILNNSINGGYICIDFGGADNITFDCEGRSISGSGGYDTGIGLYYSNNNTIRNCNVTGYYWGLRLLNSINNRLINLTLEENILYDFDIGTTDTSHCNNNLTNILGSGGRPIELYNYSANIQNKTLSELVLCNADFSNVTNVTVTGSATLKNNQFLIHLTNNATISDINCTNLHFGINITASNSSTITNATVSNNFVGISIGNIPQNSLYNTISDSRIENNSYFGIWGAGTNSFYNLFYNNLFNNTYNAYIGYGPENYWNITLNCSAGPNIIGGDCMGGNYWADPNGTGFSENCTDWDGNGICDNAKTVPSNNMDFLPLAPEKPPFIMINNPANDTINSDFFNFTYNEVNCSWYSVDGGANVTNCSIFNLGWTGTLTVSGDGGHNLTIWANDSKGNVNSTIRYWVRDTTPPVITIDSPLNKSYNVSSILFNVSLNETGSVCFVDYGIGNKTMNFILPDLCNYTNSSMNDDFYQAIFYCNDTAGNWNSTSVYFTVAIPPTITINNPINGTTNSDFFEFTYNEVNCSWYSVGGGANITNCSIAYYFLQWEGMLTGIFDGQRNITVWANDSKGNVNSTIRYWVRDTTPPPIIIFSPENKTYNTTNINLNVSSDGTDQGWKYNLNGADNSTFYPNTTINAQCGPNTIWVYVNDSLGNTNSSSVVFYVNYTAPEILNPYHYASEDGGWGENHTFRVNCSDKDGDNASLYLWHRKTPSDPWSMLGEQNCSGTLSQIYTFTISYFACNNVTPLGTNSQYKFNVSDPHGLKNETEPQNFTVGKDNVTVYVYSLDGGWAWRNGSDYVNLSVLFYDEDRNEYVGSGNATIWVTTNASDPNSWDPGKFRSINPAEYVNYSFLADGEPPLYECNYTVGVQKWKAGMGGIYGDACYKAVNSSIQNVTIRSDLRPYVFYPTDTIGFLKGQIINVNGFLQDDCSDSLGYGVDSATIGFHGGSPQEYRLEHSGGSIRYCTNNWQEGGGWYNCSWESTGQLTGDWDIAIRVDSGYYVLNETIEEDAFNLGFAPILSNPSVSPSVDGWGANHAFQVYFRDEDWNTDNISLWKSFDNVTWDLVNWNLNYSGGGKPVYFYERFTCSDSNRTPGKLNYYKFNVTDPFNFTNETVVNTFNLTEDNVSATVDSSASNDNVSMLNETATLRFRISDDDYGIYPDGVKGWIWITENGKDYSRALNCTTSSGYCQVSYDPSPSSQFGTQYWKGGTNDSCYEHQNSTNETIEIVNPLSSIRIHPLAVINGSDVNLSAFVYDFQAIWANVTLPDSTVQKLLMANNANTSFSSTGLTGRYNITFYANDSKDERVNRSGYYFESFVSIVFNVSVVDYLSGGVDTNITFYYRNESIWSNSSMNGIHSTRTVDSVLDVEFRGYSGRLRVLLIGINLSSENNENFGIDRHTGISGYLVTYGINSTYNMTNASVKIYYGDTGYSDEDNLQLYKCDSYNFTSRTCPASWTDITSSSTQNKTGHYFSILVTSFSGFSIMQYTAYQPPSPPPGGTSGFTCSINWSCGEWGPCLPNGTQIRTCFDLGTCGTGNRTEYGNCNYAPTCSDNILNQDESDTDCGGNCLPCGGGKACRADSDCESGFCDQSVCAPVVAPSEEGKQQEGDEHIEPFLFWIMEAIFIIILILIFSMTYLLYKEKKEITSTC